MTSFSFTHRRHSPRQSTQRSSPASRTPLHNAYSSQFMSNDFQNEIRFFGNDFLTGLLAASREDEQWLIEHLDFQSPVQVWNRFALNSAA